MAKCNFLFISLKYLQINNNNYIRNKNNNINNNDDDNNIQYKMYFTTRGIETPIHVSPEFTPVDIILLAPI